MIGHKGTWVRWEGHLRKKIWQTLQSFIDSINIYIYIYKCETKVWLISVLIITKQGLELMIIFQVWLGKTISKVAITKTNQAKEKSWRRRPPKRKVFFKTQASYDLFVRLLVH